jgi:hypothetical protein
MEQTAQSANSESLLPIDTDYLIKATEANRLRNQTSSTPTEPPVSTPAPASQPQSVVTQNQNPIPSPRNPNPPVNNTSSQTQASSSFSEPVPETPQNVDDSDNLPVTNNISSEESTSISTTSSSSRSNNSESFALANTNTPPTRQLEVRTNNSLFVDVSVIIWFLVLFSVVVLRLRKLTWQFSFSPNSRQKPFTPPLIRKHTLNSLQPTTMMDHQFRSRLDKLKQKHSSLPQHEN